VKHISTLIADINFILTPSTSGGVRDEVLKNFQERLSNHVKDTLEAKVTKEREPKVLYGSEIGEVCHRKLWYKLSNASSESLLPHVYFKFLYGDIIEETALLLAEAAGHTVEHAQEKVVYTAGDWQVRGRMDATIDGVMVDVKSMSTYGMDKLGLDLDLYDDPFGYIDQVSFYRNFGTTGAEDVAILAADKTLGHIKLAQGRGISKDTQVARITATTRTLDGPGIPSRAYEAKPEGASGNMKLCTQCSYCPYKQACWPGLRTFIYSNGPVYLTEVAKLPKVLEVPSG
jgi:hypothetical protein